MMKDYLRGDNHMEKYADYFWDAFLPPQHWEFEGKDQLCSHMPFLSYIGPSSNHITLERKCIQFNFTPITQASTLDRINSM